MDSTIPRLSPDDCWDRLQPPRDPTDGLSGYRKWMDGWDGQYNHTQTYTLHSPLKTLHTHAQCAHTCCRTNMEVNKGFLLRLSDVLILSSSLIATKCWHMRSASGCVTHIYIHTCYSKLLTLAWQSVTIRVGKVPSPTLLTWASHPLLPPPQPLHELVNGTSMLKALGAY